MSNNITKISQCHGITKSGKRCAKKTKEDIRYCFRHSSLKPTSSNKNSYVESHDGTNISFKSQIIPNEIFCIIAQKSDVKTILVLGNVSKKIRDMCSLEEIWNQIINFE